VVREVGVHDDDEVAGRELQAVNVGGAEAELAGAGAELDLGAAVGFLELFRDVLGAIWGAVVNDDDFPVEVAKRLLAPMAQHVIVPCGTIGLNWLLDVRFAEGVVQEPDDDGEVAALIVGW